MQLRKIRQRSLFPPQKFYGQKYASGCDIHCAIMHRQKPKTSNTLYTQQFCIGSPVFALYKYAKITRKKSTSWQSLCITVYTREALPQQRSILFCILCSELKTTMVQMVMIDSKASPQRYSQKIVPSVDDVLFKRNTAREIANAKKGPRSREKIHRRDVP